ncbi:hypothetical protein VTP01DRAFT_2633 [Rhizomucor pusillus]|uniref:uncharacterized protein n=1 Tax=Rhizomucor pusillus TaxID=4840 RepID=UPI0037427ABD
MPDSYFFVGELCLYLSGTLKEHESNLKHSGHLISFQDAWSFNIVAILYWYRRSMENKHPATLGFYRAAEQA